MSWPSFLTSSAAWLFLAAVPLVLLYFLKLKRPRRELPSLVLWQQVLRDERVNSPFRRLKRNLLLLLQLLLLCLLVLAAMQPYWRMASGGAERLLVMLDCSASMSALDRAGGESRLQVAKDRVRQLIDGLERDQEMAILAFARAPRLMSSFASNKRVLGDALKRVESLDQGDDLEAALRMAGAMAQTTEIGRVLLFSDGNLPALTRIELPFAVDYVRVPGAGPNLGITHLHASRDLKGGWRLFAQVESSSDTPAPARLRVWQDGQQLHQELVVPRGVHGQRFVFPLPGESRCAIELRLEVDGFDSVAADNRGFLELVPLRPVRVRVGEGLDLYRRALAVHPEVEVLASDSKVPPDLAIDRDPGAASGAPVRFSVGVIPSDLEGILRAGAGGATVVDWQRMDPLLEHVELADLVVLDSIRWAGAGNEGEVEKRGFEVVVHGDQGPLLLRRGRFLGEAHYALLFDSERSTLPYRLGFPIIVSNLVGIAMRAAGLREVVALQAGVLPPTPLPKGSDCELVTPAGARVPVRIDPGGRMIGMPAPRAGWYTIEANGKEIRRVGVNLLDAGESLLASRASLKVGELTLMAANKELEADRPLWSWLVLLALPVLLIEWWLFRRPRMAPSRKGRA